MMDNSTREDSENQRIAGYMAPVARELYLKLRNYHYMAPITKLRCPDLENACSSKDWRLYIPKFMERFWPFLSDDAKLVAWLLAQDRADAEEEALITRKEDAERWEYDQDRSNMEE